MGTGERHPGNSPRRSGRQTYFFARRLRPEGVLWSLDLHGDYAFRFKPGRVRVAADITNLFNTQAVVSYDQNTQRKFGVTNPDFGRRTQYQDPRQIRLGIRFEL